VIGKEVVISKMEITTRTVSYSYFGKKVRKMLKGGGKDA